MTWLRRLLGRIRCWRRRSHDWHGVGLPVQRPGHRGGWVPAKCVECAAETTLELSPAQISAAKSAYHEAMRKQLRAVH